MPFRSGAISYRRFAVTGAAPNMLESKVYGLLREHALGELEPIKPGEIHVGWTAGRHLFDSLFDFERIGFGGGLLLGLRSDTVRIPPEIKKAYIAMAEDARLVPAKDGGGAYLPRSAKKEAREEALRRARACACMHRSSMGSRKSLPRPRRSRRARCARTVMQVCSSSGGGAPLLRRPRAGGRR